MMMKCDKCKTNNEVQLPDWGVVNTSTCGFCGYVMQFIPILTEDMPEISAKDWEDEKFTTLRPGESFGRFEEITDTDRLNWILKQMTIDDVGDGEFFAPGVVISHENLETALQNEGFFEAFKRVYRTDEEPLGKTPDEGMEREVILAGIDDAIRKEREG